MSKQLTTKLRTLSGISSGNTCVVYLPPSIKKEVAVDYKEINVDEDRRYILVYGLYAFQRNKMGHSFDTFQLYTYDSIEKRLSYRYIDADCDVMVFKKSDNHPEANKLFKEYEDSLFWNGLGKANVTIGSDPEIFVESDKGALLPAFKFLPGKDKPAIAPRVNYGGNALYWDGFQAEFTTTPKECLGWHTDSVRAGLLGVLTEARKFDKGAKLSTKTLVHLLPEDKKDAKPEHIEFGCVPSFNAYGINAEIPPGEIVPVRSAGGHMHFGFGHHAIKPTKEAIVDMVKALDAIVGVMCVSLFQSYDDSRRRELYGRPGEYRLPAYGFEYRVLSNAWLIHPMLMNLCFDVARKCLELSMKKRMDLWKAKEEDIVRVIMECDVKGAHKILIENRNVMESILRSCYPQFKKESIEQLFFLILNGYESSGFGNNIHENWNLDKEWAGHAGYKEVNGMMKVLKVENKIALSLPKTAAPKKKRSIGKKIVTLAKRKVFSRSKKKAA